MVLVFLTLTVEGDCFAQLPPGFSYRFALAQAAKALRSPEFQLQPLRKLPVSPSKKSNDYNQNTETRRHRALMYGRKAFQTAYFAERNEI